MIPEMILNVMLVCLRVFLLACVPAGLLLLRDDDDDGNDDVEYDDD